MKEELAKKALKLPTYKKKIQAHKILNKIESTGYRKNFILYWNTYHEESSLFHH